MLPLKQGRAKKKPSGKDRDRRKKKALTGPRKPAKKKRAQRRAMIAARRRRRASLPELAIRWTRRVDRRVDRVLVRAEPLVLRAWAEGRRGLAALVEAAAALGQARIRTRRAPAALDGAPRCGRSASSRLRLLGLAERRTRAAARRGRARLDPGERRAHPGAGDLRRDRRLPPPACWSLSSSTTAASRSAARATPASPKSARGADRRHPHAGRRPLLPAGRGRPARRRARGRSPPAAAGRGSAASSSSSAC